MPAIFSKAGSPSDDAKLALVWQRLEPRYFVPQKMCSSAKETVTALVLARFSRTFIFNIFAYTSNNSPHTLTERWANVTDVESTFYHRNSKTSTALQRETAVTVHLKSKQLLLFAFPGQRSRS